MLIVPRELMDLALQYQAAAEAEAKAVGLWHGYLQVIEVKEDDPSYERLMAQMLEKHELKMQAWDKLDSAMREHPQDAAKG